MDRQASGDPALQRPRLRPVEAFPGPEGRTCLRDPQGFSDRLLLLPPQALLIISLFDGQRSLLDIQAEVARRTGQLLFKEPLAELIEKLDGALFLESERFRREKARLIAEFSAAPVRAAWHAGTSYERDPAALRRVLDGLFAGPGCQPGSAFSCGQPAGRLRALIAPHVDLKRGGACYAAGYGELARAASADSFLILGVSHAPSRRRYVLCVKDFDTPLGVVPAHRELIESVQSRCRTDFREEEFLHRNEHSVEFQALLLRYLLGARARIAPVLCSSLPALAAGGDPESDAEAEEFIAALGAALEERGREVCLVAAADLAHVGRRFGQELSLSPQLLRDLELQDRSMIEGVLARDAAGFFRFIQRERDRRNVCGVPAIYTLLRLLPDGGPPGHLLDYGQAPDAASDSVVSFMAAAFYDA